MKPNTAKLDRSRLRSAEFSVITSNCWGAEIYRELDLPYLTPFVGLFIHAPCYMKILRDLRGYLGAPLRFAPTSRYIGKTEYPIGLLRDDVEIHFLHYKSDDEATEKWTRRSQRVLWEPDRQFVMFCDRDGCTLQMIEEFDKMNFPHKVCFTAKPYPQFRSCVWIKSSQGQPHVADGLRLYRSSRRYFDVVNWLNGGSGKISVVKKIRRRLGV